MIKARTDEQFTVTWTAPATQMFTGYKVTVREGDNDKTETLSKGITSVVITGLAAGTEYDIEVVTLNNQDNSSPLTGKASTREFRLAYQNKYLI